MDDDVSANSQQFERRSTSELSESELYGASFADVYDRWYDAPTDTEATLQALTGLVSAGSTVVELAAGTGRIAVPLAAAGYTVWALDSSEQMIDQLQARASAALVGPDSARLRPLRADMASEPWPELAAGSCQLVFGAWNALWNVTSQAGQLATLRNAAAALAPGGLLLLESAVPQVPTPDAPNPVLSLRSVDLDEVVLIATSTDSDAQTVTGQHLQFLVDGTFRLRPWRVRYLTPEQTDAMAIEAGFELIGAWADWAGNPFEPDSTQRIVQYRRVSRG